MGEISDMHLSMKDVNALGQITQKGWGVSSMPNSVNCSLHGDTITMKFITVVHFAADQALRSQSDRVSHESIEVITKCVADMKKRFKEMTGNSLKLKEISNTDSLEVIAATNLSPRRVAYYRRQVTLQVV
jgi:hypothetical protein